WRHRSERYGEKLATPDTSVGDLIGDVDPIKVAEGRTLGDPETVHYGLVPRTNRGIFSVNELPDLAERIQVALLNVLEERDIQVRGYQLRLPLDLLLVASANPEDYTNRGRIITPLKDRFGAEVRTHYPLRLDDELRLVRQEAVLTWEGSPLGKPVLPDHVVEVIARFTRGVREAPQIDARSGVSARFAIAAAETAAASAVRRAAVTGEETPVVRVVDLPAVVPTSLGKVEFDQLEEGRELDLLKHLLRRAVADTYRSRLGGQDVSGLLRRFEDGGTVETGDLVPAAELLRRVGPVPGLAQLLRRLGDDEGAETPGLAAAALEFTMEGLHLGKRLAKEELPGRAVYGG
ncbi:MAG TPA: sigma 54-interacting transcriptional regulator, partial [Actinomycetota bacterium]|nr:sigma 54-interacting transcriptional regulator [Actinomycetota bacterium]